MPLWALIALIVLALVGALVVTLLLVGWHMLRQIQRDYSLGP